ncbi:MAG: hypothetical protein GQ544_06565 [Candidatus Aminicenantes bacterium]|nr:hypothetical protein [Candidatus Aminicenantes bacterium]
MSFQAVWAPGTINMVTIALPAPKAANVTFRKLAFPGKDYREIALVSQREKNNNIRCQAGLQY